MLLKNDLTGGFKQKDRLSVSNQSDKWQKSCKEKIYINNIKEIQFLQKMVKKKLEIPIKTFDENCQMVVFNAKSEY